MSEIASLQANAVHGGTRTATGKWTVIIALSTLSLSGIAALLFITRWGIGLSYDSVSYIAIARDLLSGRGYPTVLWFYRTTHWPPLLPLALAAIGTLRIDPLIGARWLNTGLFAANIALVGAIVNRYGGLFWPSVLASYVILASPNMLMIHAMAWSEPLFIFLGFLGILLLADYMDRRVPAFLFASASAVAGAFLTRYVGGALVVAGALGLLLLSRKPSRMRLIDTAIFVAVSSLPTLLWMLRNIQVEGSATDRSAAFHPVTLANAVLGLLTSSTWLLPGRIPHRAIVWLALAAGAGIASVVAWKRRQRQGDGGHPIQVLPTLPALLVIFMASYLALVVAATSFLDNAVFDDRTLSPVFAAGVLLVFCAVAGRWRFGQISRPVQAGALLLGLYLAGFYAVRGVEYAAGVYREGLGYAGKAWRESGTIRGVEALPPGVRIYSNAPDAIYILAAKTATLVPAKINWGSVSPNASYSAQLSEMREELQLGRAVVVHFDLRRGPDRGLERELALTPIVKARDGEIYRMKGAPIPGSQ